MAPDLKFRLIPAVYDATTKSFKPAETIPATTTIDGVSVDVFMTVIYNSDINCDPEKDIAFYAVLDGAGVISLDEMQKLQKAGIEAQKARTQLRNPPTDTTV